MEHQIRRYEVVTAALLDRALCVPCIAARGSVSVETAAKMLDTIASALVLHREAGRCLACGATGIVHFVAREAA